MFQYHPGSGPPASGHNTLLPAVPAKSVPSAGAAVFMTIPYSHDPVLLYGLGRLNSRYHVRKCLPKTGYRQASGQMHDMVIIRSHCKNLFLGQHDEVYEVKAGKVDGCLVGGIMTVWKKL